MATATSWAQALALGAPYPGLRAFEPNEAMLFFGRQPQVDDLLKRLSRGRLLAVVGTSGSGKSSLVKAGLLPALYRGFLVGATSRWRIAMMRPGNAPLGNLARALSAVSVGGGDRVAQMERSTQGLAAVVAQTEFAAGESLLIVVDQFEELFRFEREKRTEDGGAQASLFVQSLLEATDAPGTAVYVILTMRSDFLGDCTRFRGLPAALNDSQYLVPRLTREQRREAIERPLQMVGAQMAPRLVQRLLNELGDEQDQLPVLQHALNRTYADWQRRGSAGEIDFEHYEAAGMLSGALNDHATAVFNSLTTAGREWAGPLFRALTTFDGARAIRRPARFETLCEVTGARSDEDRRHLGDVIRSYAAPENSLLLVDGELNPDRVVDISHESLIRNWKQLALWLAEERDAVNWYRDVADDVRLHAAGQADTWRGAKLEKACGFLAPGGWNAAWAARNQLAQVAPFQDVADFLDKSSSVEAELERQAQERHSKELRDAERMAESERRARRWTQVAGALVALVLLIGIALLFEKAGSATQKANASEAKAAAERANAEAKASSARLEAVIESLKNQQTQNEELQASLEGLQSSMKHTTEERTKLQTELQKLRREQDRVTVQLNQAVQQREIYVKGDAKSASPGPKGK
jgi:energy-coupling factor transporter ATP-binding protein EcfA2/cell division protein FtsB